jgi:DNA polymerase I-like protein with 3'-5' exonuclease and polymerase domains
MSARAQELFPSLRGQGMIAIDCETNDPDLKNSGPGYHRGGFICGVSIGTESGFRAYYPIAHQGGGNLDKTKVLSWLKAELADANVPKVGANLGYDLGFLAEAGVDVRGPLYDIQLAEPLIDETRRSYSLEALAQHYLEEGKIDAALEEWITGNLRDDAGRKLNGRNFKSAIWRAPVSVVAPYAIGDIDLPLRIFAQQRKKLERLKLWQLFEMEISLIPMLLAMRRRGVAVDIPYAERLYRSFNRRQVAMYAQIRDAAGLEFELWNAKSVGAVFDKLGIDYPRTLITRAPSFTKEWLAHHEHPMARALRELRRLDKLKETFIKGAIIEGSYRGRIHCQFNQLRSDGLGTVSGRFSSSMPNLQQIPARGDDGKAIRSAFIPDAGNVWACFDWSQIEYRLIVNDAAHFNMRGAGAVVDIYNSDPSADFHSVIAALTNLPRDAAKTVNFAIAYGEGVAKLCADLGLSEPAGRRLLREYHRKAPFMRPIMEYWMGRAEQDYELRTLLGRRRRFTKWAIRRGGKTIYLDHRVPGAKLAFTYAALNARIQGSAADIMKYAMSEVWTSGVCDVLGAPHLSVHDELDFSAPENKAGREALAEVKNIMESVVDISVKLTVDAKTGKNWGACK